MGLRSTLSAGAITLLALTAPSCHPAPQAVPESPDLRPPQARNWAAPPLGFSSWNFAGGSYPGEAHACAVADAMVARGLKDAGYVYLMAFDGWWATIDKDPRAASGELLPNPERWPHGIPYVCDYIHGKGLKVAGYSDIGRNGYSDRDGHQIGSYPFYRQAAEQFARWGWDYIKIDDCNDGGPASKPQAFAEFCSALGSNSSGRPIFLSLSTPSTPSAPDFAPHCANMWRTSNDINGPGSATFNRATNLAFDSAEEFWWNQAPGRWNDIDMMVVGIKGISPVQNRTLMNLWAIRGAPLLIGCDVVHVPPEVIAVLTNPEVLAVDQDPLCAQGRKVREDLPNVQVHAKPLGSFTGGQYAVVLANRTPTPQNITVHWRDLGLCNGRLSVRDLNAHADLGAFADRFTAQQMPPYGSIMLKITGGVVDWSRPREYEAECAFNTFSGTVQHRAYREGFSSYACVEGIGRGAENFLQFNQVAAPRDGAYRMVVYYASAGNTEVVATGRKNAASTDHMIDIDAFRVARAEPRTCLVSVNGGPGFPVALPPTGGASRVGSVEVPVRLHKGANRIRFFHNTQPVPALDKITILADAAPVPNQAAFVQLDAQTSGDWPDHYGHEAYSIFGAGANVPPELRLGFRHGTWHYYNPNGWGDNPGIGLIVLEQQTSDPRALRRPGAGPGQRIAACIRRPDSLTIEVDVADARPRRVAFYAVDWDRKGRSMKVEAFDGGTNTLLEQQTVADYAAGRYLVYRITGRTKFTFTSLTGPDVMLQGVFIDPEPAAQ